MRVAVLDARGRLIGARNGAKGIDPGDLPTDGSYYLDGDRFMPVGRGAGKPFAPTVDRDKAMYLALTAMINGTPIPQECADWCAWYRKHNAT